VEIQIESISEAVRNGDFEVIPM